MQYKIRSGNAEFFFVLYEDLLLERVVEEDSNTAQIRTGLVEKDTLEQVEILYFYFSTVTGTCICLLRSIRWKKVSLIL